MNSVDTILKSLELQIICIGYFKNKGEVDLYFYK